MVSISLSNTVFMACLSCVVLSCTTTMSSTAVFPSPSFSPRRVNSLPSSYVLCSPVLACPARQKAHFFCPTLCNYRGGRGGEGGQLDRSQTIVRYISTQKHTKLNNRRNKQSQAFIGFQIIKENIFKISRSVGL